MKTKQLLTLLILLGALGAAALVLRTRKESQTGDRGSSTIYRDLVFPDLDVNAVTAVTITDFEGSVHMAKTEAGWSLTERDGYGVDFGKLSDLVQTLGRLKITQGMPVPDSALGRVALLDPQGGETTPETAAKRIDLHGGPGTTSLASLLIGKSPGSANDSFGQGKIVKANSDTGMAWIVDEQFSNASTEPRDWLSQDFFAVDGLRSISFTAPVEEDSWSARRTDENSDFLIDDPGPDMQTDASKLSAFKYLLGSPGFEDVLNKDEATSIDFAQGGCRATLKTFDGFTYDLDILPEVAKPENDEQAPRTLGYFLKVAVAGSFKETREPAEDESEEVKKAADEAFAAELEALKTKLSTEQQLAGNIYRVSEYTLTSLIKKKAELLVAVTESEATETQESPDPAPALQPHPEQAVALDPAVASDQRPTPQPESAPPAGTATQSPDQPQADEQPQLPTADEPHGIDPKHPSTQDPQTEPKNEAPVQAPAKEPIEEPSRGSSSNGALEQSSAELEKPQNGQPQEPGSSAEAPADEAPQ
jgi:hypothetical protein